MGKETKLLGLAEKEFGTLSEAEVKFFTATAKGDVADYQSDDELDKPENADKWGDERVLQANRIEWLCTDRDALKCITHKGIQVLGLRVEGKLDLAFAKLDFPFLFLNDVFKETISLQNSTFKAVYLSGTHTVEIIADGMEVEGSVFLNEGFKAKGEVRLVGVVIGGVLNCEKGEFINPKGFALSADGLKVEGSVFLRNAFKAMGEVRLSYAEIGVVLDCTGGKFISPWREGVNANGVRWGVALNADGSKVKGSVDLKKGFKAEGEVRLLGAEIGGNLSCTKGEFVNRIGGALCADRVKVKGSVLLKNGFKAMGEVRLLGAEIDGDFDCKEGEFIKPQPLNPAFGLFWSFVI